jgi:hypothetical protein
MRTMAMVVLAAAVGCEGTEPADGPLDCEAPDFSATVFTLDDGTASIEGSVQLPDDVPAGRSFEVGLDAGGVYFGGVTDDLGASTETCGPTIPFVLHDLPAGTYRVEAGVQTATGGAGNLEWEGMSAEVTVADGETVDGVTVSLQLAR